MPKRLCPFDENRIQMKTRVDMWHVGKEQYKQEVFEKTKQMMMKGAIDARKAELKGKNKPAEIFENNGKNNIGPVYKVLKERAGCYYCRVKSSSVCCAYCNKNSCLDTCSKVCYGCGYTFCTSCCSICYDFSDERVFCVSCFDSPLY